MVKHLFQKGFYIIFIFAKYNLLFRDTYGCVLRILVLCLRYLSIRLLGKIFEKKGSFKFGAANFIEFSLRRYRIWKICFYRRGFILSLGSNSSKIQLREFYYSGSCKLSSRILITKSTHNLYCVYFFCNGIMKIYSADTLSKTFIKYCCRTFIQGRQTKTK